MYSIGSVASNCDKEMRYEKVNSFLAHKNRAGGHYWNKFNGKKVKGMQNKSVGKTRCWKYNSRPPNAIKTLNLLLINSLRLIDNVMTILLK